ncbi:type II toxin-antitoxin system Phd/YefM family antitoxin [Fibrella aquatica]|jgi:antitoxin (DNA-binding transcriptional repressor) of toxin-antitoxin stability system|uniref:type II toxin-antitoxin system Phd/YefM family antitoxin n=1 Tax=Fibrella aquatica TaxID=3242487 RepID=UPI0035205DDC
MRTMTIGELKAHFSDVIQDVKSGEEIAVAFGKKKEIVAYLIPKEARTPVKRQLGILANKGQVTFGADFKLTDDEFLGL